MILHPDLLMDQLPPSKIRDELWVNGQRYLYIAFLTIRRRVLFGTHSLSYHQIFEVIDALSSDS